MLGAMNPRDEFEAAALAALKPGPMSAHVLLETADGGAEMVFYGDGPTFQNGGVLVIPPGTERGPSPQ